MADNEAYPVQIQRKMILIGDGATGKTCLLYTFREGQFPPDNRYIPTVFDTCIVDMEVRGHPVELSLWDTAGQEEFDRLRMMCYPGVNIVLLCFSVDSPDSLENAYEKWFREATKQAKGAPIILVALKTDLRADQSTIEHLARFGQAPVTYAQGQAVAKRMNAAKYVECSSIRNLNIRQVFETAANLAVSPEDLPNAKPESGCCVIL
ncbi:GTP-binding protein, rho subfamily [Martensiomyces pterosporus]|nr:GTP-binding protein, rho subfamily [Martensiomyces pterosporus]